MILRTSNSCRAITEDGSIISWSKVSGSGELIIEAEVCSGDDPQPRFHTLVRTPLPPCYVRQIAKIPGSSIGVLVTGALPGEAPPGGVAVRLVNLLAPSSESPSFRLATLYPGFDVKHVLCNRERLVLLSAGAFYLYRLPDLALLHILPIPQAALRDSGGVLSAVTSNVGRVWGYVAASGASPSSAPTQPRVVAWPCALSSTSLLAYGVQCPDGTHAIALFDALGLASLPLVKTEHGSPVRHLRFDRRGAMLASVSERGSHAHVFAVPSGDHLCKRNLAYSGLEVFGMSFTPQGDALAVGVKECAYVTWLGGLEQRATPHVCGTLANADFVRSGRNLPLRTLGLGKLYLEIPHEGIVEEVGELFNSRGSRVEIRRDGAPSPFLLIFSSLRNLLFVNAKGTVTRFRISQGKASQFM